jgi:hypothetical protein
MDIAYSNVQDHEAKIRLLHERIEFHAGCATEFLRFFNHPRVQCNSHLQRMMQHFSQYHQGECMRLQVKLEAELNNVPLRALTD